MKEFRENIIDVVAATFKLRTYLSSQAKACAYQLQKE